MASRQNECNKVNIGQYVITKGAARGGAEGAQAPPLALRILMFVFLEVEIGFIAESSSAVPQGAATHLLSNQAVMNFRDVRNLMF